MEPTAPTTPNTRERRSRRQRATEEAAAADAEALITDPRRARALIAENADMRHALVQTEQIHAKLQGLIEELTVEPWPVARFVRLVETSRGQRALVLSDGSWRLVTFHPDCPLESLEVGDFVQLSEQRNLVMDTLGVNMPSGGELARFERFTPDQRIVVRSRDEELVVDAGARLDLDALVPGDPIRWDRTAELALERFEPEEGDSFLLEDVKEQSRDLIGGLGPIFDRLFEGLALPLLQPDATLTLKLGEPPVALLHGPPGCGKTLLARTLAAEVQRVTGRKCRFAVVRPGEFKSPYVGETESRIRACFAALKRASQDELVVLFIDEIDAIGRIRGGAVSQHADSALAALLAEIGGFEQRGNVAIIAATNRRDVLDSALISRFQDMDLPVGRPKRAAAESIFRIHLPESLPFAGATGSTHDSAQLRDATIASAVSQLYAPNAGGEVCRIGLRDGTTRIVHARELVSGRLIGQIVRMAKRSALARHHRGGVLGIDPSDLAEAVGKVIGDLSRLITPSNARAHLDDLPQDVDVVRVEPLRPRAARSMKVVSHAG